MQLFPWRKKPVAEPPPPQSLTVTQDSPTRFTVTISGIVTRDQVTAAQQQILAAGHPDRKSRGLIRAEGLQGIARGFDGGMDDVERLFAIDQVVDRIAVVAAPALHEKLNLFMGGWVRKAQLKFFAPAELARAQSWLDQE